MPISDKPIRKKSTQSAVDPESGLPLAPPRWFAALAIAAMLLGFFMSPEILMLTGFTAQNLHSDIASARYTTWIEIQALRTGLLGFALVAILWPRLVSASVTRRIMAVEPRERAWVDTPSALVNFSLFASLACVAIAYAQHRFGGSIFSAQWLIFIEREDGVIEYATALFYLVASVVSAVLAYRSRHWKARAWMLGILAVLFFGVSGEEISWGQRIFDIETPEFFETYNIQNETNLHNMAGYTVDHALYLGVLLYGGVVPFLARRIPFFRKLFGVVGLPIPSLGLTIGFLALSVYPWVARATMPASVLSHYDFYRAAATQGQSVPFVDLPFEMSSELRELLTAICFLLLMVELWRGAPEARRPRVPSHRERERAELVEVG